MRARERLELATGRAQLLLLRRALCAATGLRPGVARIAGCDVAYLHRPGRGGTPLVCIHGFGGDKETWLLAAPWMSRRRPLLLIDLPGHGASGDIAEAAASARAQAEVVRALLDRLGLDRVILCGNSMGGGVSLRLARSWPERVRGLILIGSTAPEYVENDFVRRIKAGGDNDLIPDGEAGQERLTRLVLEKPPRVPRALQRYVVRERALARPRLERVWRGWGAAAGDDALPRDVEAIRHPALVVHGERDRVIDVATARALAARLPEARLIVLGGVGHVPQLEVPRRVARLIERFARRL